MTTIDQVPVDAPNTVDTPDAPNTVLPKLDLNPYKTRRVFVIAAIALQAVFVFALAIQPAFIMDARPNCHI